MKISNGSYKVWENGDRLYRILKVFVYFGILFYIFCIDMFDNEIRNFLIGLFEVEFVLNVIGLCFFCGVSLV